MEITGNFTAGDYSSRKLREMLEQTDSLSEHQRCGIVRELERRNDARSFAGNWQRAAAGSQMQSRRI